MGSTAEQLASQANVPAVCRCVPPYEGGRRILEQDAFYELLASLTPGASPSLLILGPLSCPPEPAS